MNLMKAVSRLWIVSVLVLTVSTVVNGQQTHLQGEPNQITTEIKRLELLRLSDPQAFSDGLNNLLPSIDKMSSYQFCHFKFLQAYQTAFSGDSMKALRDMEEIISGCDDLRARVRLDALIANISAISGDYVKASTHIDNAIQNADQTVDMVTKGIAYSGASSVYNILDQHELSSNYSELLFNINQDSESECRFAFSNTLREINTGENIPSFSQIENSAKKCRDSGHHVLANSIILEFLKEILSQESLNQSEKAKYTELVNDLKSEIDRSPYKNVQVAFTSVSAKIALLNEDYENSRNLGQQALQLNENLGASEQLILALDVLEAEARQRQDFESAYDYLKKKNLAELQIYDQSKSKQLAFMTVKHANLAKEFEIEQLNQQKAVLELEKKLARQEANNQRLVILLILTLLALVLLWLFKIKKRHDYFKGVSEIDHLTKVLTRKAFEEQVHKVLDASKAHKETVNVAILDLDHFKQVNDTHGHLVGDWVLKNVVYAIKEMMEPNMIIARLGGEEFCVVMHGVSAEVMMAKVEKMRQAIEDFDCSDSGAELTVTASFGVTSSDVSGYNLPMLLTHADVALFEAKNKGRNRVVAFEPVNGNK